MFRLVSAVLLYLLTTAVASAQVRPIDITVRTGESTHIVVATVADISPRSGTSAFGDSLFISDLALSVSETLKGSPTPVLTVTVEGGEIGSIGMRRSNVPALRRGDKAIYFLDQAGQGGWIPHRHLGILRLDPTDRIEQSQVTLAEARTLIQNALPGVSEPPTYSYRVIRQYPHDTGAFTQGLELRDNVLYESTGLVGSSSLRQVNLHTGAVVRKVNVPPPYFAEGMTIVGGRIFQLTWQSGVGFIYDVATFAKIGEFNYPGEGWGLTHDAQNLIMSDGTSQIRFLDPVSLQTLRTISVRDSQLRPVTQLNELEYVNGQIYANIWQTNIIARIDPVSGRVTAWIDLGGLLPPGTSADVLNGIAYDAVSNRLFVTGKLWPTLFELVLEPPTQ